MKPVLRKYLYAALTVFSLVFAAYISIHGKSKDEFPRLKERQGMLAQAPEWPQTKTRIEKLTATLEAQPKDVKTTLTLAKEFMQEGRITGDYSYYNKAALDLVNRALAIEPQNFEAVCYKSMVYLSQHRFAEGREYAEKAMNVNPYNSFVYGLMCDADVELGNYPDAVKVADKMVSIRPDIRSYSRVSYLREIHGDAAGALEAIGMAVSAGYPGYEDTEWARMVQAHLYEDTGNLEKAEEAYRRSLAERPEYPFALAGLGKIARFKKDYPAAIEYFEKAGKIMSDASFYEELIDLYRLNQQPDKSETYARTTIAALLADNITANKDKDMGHYSDRDLALLYLKTGEPEKALNHARIEYERRPENIDACETLAWVLYKQGQVAAALPLMEKALRTGSQVPERLVMAGLVYCANNQFEKGKPMIAKGLSLKPYMNEALATEAQTRING